MKIIIDGIQIETERENGSHPVCNDEVEMKSPLRLSTAEENLTSVFQTPEA